MSEKFVITGGAGLIGSNLAKRLSKDNDVLVIDDLSTGRMENLGCMDYRLKKYYFMC